MIQEYKPKIIQDAFDRVLTIKREDALRKVEKSPTERKTLVITYHPGLPSVTKLVREQWEVMTKQVGLSRDALRNHHLLVTNDTKTWQTF